MKLESGIKISFKSWLNSKKIIGIPIWIWAILVSLVNSSRLFSENPNYPVKLFLFDAMGGFIFAMIFVYVWYRISVKKQDKLKS